MAERTIRDFHGDHVFRDEAGRIWVPLDKKISGMARAWDEADEALSRYAAQTASRFIDGFSAKGKAPERPTNPYRRAAEIREG